MKSLRGGIFFVALALISPLAFGQTRWTGNASGAWEDPTNWTEGVPDATTQARFLTGATFTSTSGGTFTPSGVTTFTVTLSSDQSALGVLFRGQANNPSAVGGGDGIINLNIGSSDVLTIAGAAPADLTTTQAEDFYVSNGATLNLSGGTVLIQQGLVAVGDSDSLEMVNGIADTGTGTLNLTSGTLDFSSFGTAMAVGLGPNAVGAVTQSGSSIVTGTQLGVGVDGGTGTYTLQSGNLNLSEVLSVALDTGSIGTFTQTSGTVTMGAGSFVSIGTDGTGTYNLQSGALDATIATSVHIGDDVGSTGIFNQSGGTFTTGTGTAFDVGESGTGTYSLSGAGVANINGTFTIGDVGGSSGTVTQSGGTLTANTTTAAIIGNSGTGIYNLQGGSATFLGGLNIGDVLSTTGSGTLNQSGGTLTISAGTAFNVGENGTGTYSLSGAGVANINGTLTVGDQMGSSGTLNQSGGTLNATLTTSPVIIGNMGTGVYNLSGGAATFSGGLMVGATGTVNQSGGNLLVPSGETIDLSTPGSQYNLRGGTLQVGTGGLVGTTGDGTFNFGGGTLQALSGGTLTDALDGTVSGTSTLDTGSSDITITGTLTGSGGFNLVGGGTVSLNAATAQYTGATTLFSSTLALTVPDATDTFSSAIAGSSGNFNIDFVTAGSTLVLPGNQNFTGTTTIGATGTAGTLQVFSGTFGSVGEGAPGGGSLIVGQAGGGSGTFQLEGANTFTGTTTVNPGFELLANSLDSTTVTNTGTLASNASVGTVFNVGVGGTGFLNTQVGSSDGTLAIRVNGPVFDSFQTGSANLFGKVFVSGFGPLGTTQDTIVTTAPGALTTGTLNSNSTTGLFATSTAPVLLQVSLSESLANGKLFLNVTQLPISQFAATPNQVAVANSLDAILVAPPPSAAGLFTAIDNLSAAQIPDALDQLSPRGYLYMRDIAFENSTFTIQKVDGYLANIRNGFSGVDTSGLSVVSPGFSSNLGRSLGSLLAFNNEGPAPDGVNYYPESPDSSPLSPHPSSVNTSSSTISDTSESYTAPGNASGAEPNFDFSRINEFVSGNVMLGNLGQNQNSGNSEQKATTVAGSGTAGISFRMTSNLSVGVLMDYNHTDATTDSLGSHVRVDTYSPGVFATFFERGFYVNALADFGFDNYSNERQISFGGTSAQATSSPSGRQYVANLDLGYDFHPDRHWIFGPTAGVEYTHLDVDSFQETGAGPANLSVSSQSADSLRTLVGGHVIYQVRSGSILFQPNITASWQHEFLNDPFGLSSQFNIPASAPFTIQGSNPGRDSAVLGFGLTATLDNSMNLYLEYLAEVGGENYFVQSIEGGVKASF
jgi:uncharacterized protein YhjY with autotransporter beta-barrel domain